MMERSPPRRLTFVYNANSGAFNALADAAHKLLSPATYRCNLCALTHTPLGMKKAWRAFLAELSLPLEFLHADEWAAHPRHVAAPLPAIFALHDANFEVWLDAHEISGCTTLAELQSKLRTRLAQAASGKDLEGGDAP